MKRGLLTVVIITLVIVLFTRLDVTARSDYPCEVVGDILYTKPLKSVIFSHKSHVTDKGLSCDMCHPEIFYPAALKAQERPDFNMESLYKGKYCGACHNGKMAFASNTQCARCHTGVKGFKTLQKMAPVKRAVSGPSEPIMIGKDYTSVKFSHDTHTKSFKCVDCHSGLFPMSKGKTKVTMEEIYQRQSCGICHNGEKAFSANECNRCHTKRPTPKTDITYITRDMGPVKFSHNFHTKTFKCADCHTKLFAMKKGGSKMNMDAMYSGKFCGACHDGKKAFSSSECNKCHNMKGFSKDLRYKVDAIGDVVFSHKFHTAAFFCDRCHPTIFQMKKTKGKMTMEEINKGKFCGACHNGSMASPPSDCGKCHLIGS